MKRISKYVFTTCMFLILIGSFTCKTSEKVTYSGDMDENRQVYWFYVSISEYDVKNSDLKAIRLTRLGHAPESGTVKEYNYSLWKYISEGTRLAIGPFSNEEEAKQAFLFYNIKTGSHESDMSFDHDRQVYWFVLKVILRDRTNTIELKRIPGAIASGEYADFNVFLKENLFMHVMTIGPFQNAADAEESKRIYRLH